MLDNNVAAGICIDSAMLIEVGNQARHLPLNFRSGARSILAGAQRSRFRGRGMDFAESREYQPGDDVRHIDWRVTARTNSVHTKLYVEERERPVFLLMDFSASMYFGTRHCFKSVTAAKAGAYLAWSTIAGGDRLGGFVASTGKLVDLKPGSGRRAVLNLLRAMADATQQFEYQTSTNVDGVFEKALKHSARVVHPGSLVIVVSDFYDLGRSEGKYISQLQRHNDVVCVEVLDQLEDRPPTPGQYLVTDGNNLLKLDTSTRTKQTSYQQLFERRQNSTLTILSELGIPLVRLVSGTDINSTLIDAFGRSKGGTTR